MVTDHKSLEEWVKETLGTTGGPVGRSSRWHEFLTKFNLEVEYVPGNTNVVADALRRWAYPASQAARDATKHGTSEDKKEMRRLIEEEEAEERDCLVSTHSGEDTAEVREDQDPQQEAGGAPPPVALSVGPQAPPEASEGDPLLDRAETPRLGFQFRPRYRPYMRRFLSSP